ncbi:AraC family transcriptional regulator [Blastopirellula marina]|uniref:AraC family transcriptional regulator n=1 Tax=Blastopirellula marina TaxID=124 RepID=A0A2S8G0P1_9BACT|nr:AraC family transcriptional regulator [Blastopirellula marina]PQO38008.1 AraC family transcriptional regulator [Blastopirellula marina]PTL44664.1 AraC family transcriptional regulator [Blastopirellula marina]
MSNTYKTEWETRLEALFAQAPSLTLLEELFARLDEVSICIKDLEGHYLSVNNAFLRSVPKLRREDVIGKNAFDLYPHALAVGYQQQDQQLLTKGQNLHDQLEMITNPDGTLGWYITSKVLAKNVDGMVIAIVGMSRDLHAPTEKAKRYSKVAVALKKIQNEYAKPLRVQQLAEESGLSVSQFERIMRSMIQITPSQYLIRQRVEAAAVLLRDSDKNIAAVAMDCGFSDQPSFCKQFKRVTGLSPLKYRKMTRNEN